MADLRLEKLEEAVKQLSQNVAMQEELRQLRERVAMLESQAKLPASEERQSELGVGMMALTVWLGQMWAIKVSLFLQLLFCYILMRCFTTGDGKYALGYLKDWRILYGHNVDSYDETSGASLVSKICDGNIFDQTFWNNALLSEVNLYLTEVFPQAPGLSGLTVGVVLCSMAVLIWACHISFELQSVGSFGMAICHLPRGNTRVSEDKDGNRRFESISYFRLCAISFVVLSRASIAVILGFSGAWWLCQTRDVTNIMLNAVALLFILEIDDLLYKVLAPKHAMHYLSSIREFHGGSRKTWAGMDLSSIIKLTVLIVTTAMFIRFTIWDNAVKAREARDILCGGNKNFVYGTHPSLGPIFVAETEKYDLNRPPSMMPNMRDLAPEAACQSKKVGRPGAMLCPASCCGSEALQADWTANNMIMVIMIVAISVGGCLSCICVGLYLYVQREKYAVSVGTEDREENYGMLAVGARVRLIGLSQAHFNGLEGFITGGPNEKGRYTVDVIVDDDETHGLKDIDEDMTGWDPVGGITYLCCHLSRPTAIRPRIYQGVGRAPTVVGPRCWSCLLRLLLVLSPSDVIGRYQKTYSF
eukprot:g5034.t1